jgi:ectoine hydroxylase-related dioxygenase (phytanoyl-CoA dioxygenase family)
MIIDSSPPLPRADQSQLDEQGYLILAQFMDADLLARLRQAVVERFAQEGDQAGAEFKQEPGCRRLANLADKADVFREIIVMPRIVECVRGVLGPAIKLSSLNARCVPPHCDVVQPLHADMGALADEQGYWVCNTVWMLDPFTPENGALRVIPGSHRWGKLPDQVLSDRKAAHPEEVLVTGDAGTVVVMNAHLWHGCTANRTGQSRTAVHGFYARRDKPQQQYQKRLLRAETQANLSWELRKILALDDPLNDLVTTQAVPQSGFMK